MKCDRLLAVVSIQDATAGGLNPKDISQAWAAVAKGDQEAVKGHYGNAIEHYRNAWRQAAQSQIRLTVSADHSVQLHFLGNYNESYRVEVSSDLVHWKLLGTATADGDGNVEFTDSSATTGEARFYRATASSLSN